MTSVRDGRHHGNAVTCPQRCCHLTTLVFRKPSQLMTSTGCCYQGLDNIAGVVYRVVIALQAQEEVTYNQLPNFSLQTCTHMESMSSEKTCNTMLANCRRLRGLGAGLRSAGFCLLLVCLTQSLQGLADGQRRPARVCICTARPYAATIFAAFVDLIDDI